MLPPGSTIGILGGGQLGRMTALAAARLGYKTHIFAGEPDAPAVQVSAAATIASFADRAAVARFAAAVDVATCEFENVPAAALRRVAAKRAVLPRPEIIEIAQDRCYYSSALAANEEGRVASTSPTSPALTPMTQSGQEILRHVRQCNPVPRLPRLEARVSRLPRRPSVGTTLTQQRVSQPVLQPPGRIRF